MSARTPTHARGSQKGKLRKLTGSIVERAIFLCLDEWRFYVTWLSGAGESFFFSSKVYIYEYIYIWIRSCIYLYIQTYIYNEMKFISANGQWRQLVCVRVRGRCVLCLLWSSTVFHVQLHPFFLPLVPPSFFFWVKWLRLYRWWCEYTITNAKNSLIIRWDGCNFIRILCFSVDEQPRIVEMTETAIWALSASCCRVCPAVNSHHLFLFFSSPVRSAILEVVHRSRGWDVNQGGKFKYCFLCVSLAHPIPASFRLEMKHCCVRAQARCP